MEIDPHKYAQLVFDRSAKQPHGGNRPLLTNGAGAQGPSSVDKNPNPNPNLQKSTPSRS